MNRETDHTADYKALRVLVTALMCGILLFSAISIVLYFFGGIGDRFRDSSETIFRIALGISVLVMIATRIIYSKRVEVLKAANQTSREKFDLYRSINITHMAICEFISLLGIICFIILGNFLLFLIVGMGLIEMLMKFPKQEKIESVIHSGTF
jgi:hypothetical protein